MSVLKDIFQEITIRDNYRGWPLTQNTYGRRNNVSVGFTFKEDAGYIKSSINNNTSDITTEIFATKTTLRRDPTHMVIAVNKTPEEFLETYKISHEDIEVQERENLTDFERADAIHILRIIADNFGNPRYSYHGRTQI